jgi:hypothetical protein
MNKIYLTYDVEDHINENSFRSLKKILDILNKKKLKAIFFITGDMTEIILRHEHTIELLKKHEIGYHSSSHSVRPIIVEYTDVSSYQKAYELSIERETSKINNINGKIEGPGGINFLKQAFPNKKIRSFRSPGFCWTPPHLEALRELGIKYDFSIHNPGLSKPFRYKKINFYPTNLQFDNLGPLSIMALTKNAISRNYLNLFSHPNSFFNDEFWDSIYFNGNPQSKKKVKQRNFNSSYYSFFTLNRFLDIIKLLQVTKKIQITPEFVDSETLSAFKKNKVNELYLLSMKWARIFNYEPKYQLEHFNKFFLAN